MIGEELGHVITLEELQEANPKINKRIVLVNSSKYTEEAFEYLLDLIDDCEAIAFVINERKIYTHGEYFGGDLWEDSLNYFSKYALLDDNNEISAQIYAQTSKDAIQFKGEGGITLYSDYDIKRDASTIHVNYDLDAAVDKTSVVKVDDNLSLALEVDGDKIALKKLHITASGNSSPKYNISTMSIDVDVKNNTPVTIYVDYQDKNGFSLTESITQEWGYKYAYGSSANAIYENNINMFLANIENKFSEKTIDIDIKDGQYGWFVYPANIELSFIDVENGMTGGWKKHSIFWMYSQNIRYQVYRTENCGLGKTIWKLTQKQ